MITRVPVFGDIITYKGKDHNGDWHLYEGVIVGNYSPTMDFFKVVTGSKTFAVQLSEITKIQIPVGSFALVDMHTTEATKI